MMRKAPGGPALAFLAALFLAAGCASRRDAEPPPETAVRAAYDVGSATTKVKVARVDPRRNRIVEVLFSDAAPVDYQASLESGDGESVIPKAVMKRGVEVLRRLHRAARDHGAQRHRAVATEAFRRAANAEAIVARLERATGIPVEIVTQRREAILGFHGAVAAAGIDPERAAVWDAGGGSMQFVARGEDGFLLHESDHGSVPFRNRVIEAIQGRSSDRIDSPNPIAAGEMKKALALAERLAREVPEPVARRFASPRTTVLGIGGVHYYSIRGQLGTGDAPYTRAAVAAKLRSRVGATDEEIGGEYASTEVTNLILVLGTMRALGIERVRPLNVTMSDGLLVARAEGARWGR